MSGRKYRFQGKPAPLIDITMTNVDIRFEFPVAGSIQRVDLAQMQFPGSAVRTFAINRRSGFPGQSARQAANGPYGYG